MIELSKRFEIAFGSGRAKTELATKRSNAIHSLPLKMRMSPKIDSAIMKFHRPWYPASNRLSEITSANLTSPRHARPAGCLPRTPLQPGTSRQEPPATPRTRRRLHPAIAQKRASDQSDQTAECPTASPAREIPDAGCLPPDSGAYGRVPGQWIQCCRPW
jgi:hypothetical protein